MLSLVTSLQLCTDFALLHRSDTAAEWLVPVGLPDGMRRWFLTPGGEGGPAGSPVWLLPRLLGDGELLRASGEPHPHELWKAADQVGSDLPAAG